jgi:hypothetical protein
MTRLRYQDQDTSLPLREGLAECCISPKAEDRHLVSFDSRPSETALKDARMVVSELS